MTTPRRTTDDPTAPIARAPWIVPSVTDLPKLTDLTLQTGSPIDGGGDTGGSTVIS
jgi:hypothetical protein